LTIRIVQRHRGQALIKARQLGGIVEQIVSPSSASFDAILHDPPRFSIAGVLYSQAFQNQLARVVRPPMAALSFHRLTSSRR
jgi:predicted methyltransferase